MEGREGNRTLISLELGVRVLSEKAHLSFFKCASPDACLALRELVQGVKTEKESLLVSLDGRPVPANAGSLLCL